MILPSQMYNKKNTKQKKNPSLLRLYQSKGKTNSDLVDTFGQRNAISKAMKICKII